MEQAFVALRTYARNNNRRLVDVANGVIDGTVPPSDLGPPANRTP